MWTPTNSLSTTEDVNSYFFLYLYYSNAREKFDQVFKGDTPEQIKADQEANEWGRNGGDPNKYRPNGLDEKYRK